MAKTGVGAGLELAVVGAGSRGFNYARIAVDDFGAGITAVVEPDLARRALFGETFGVPPERRFAAWGEMLAGERAAHAVVIATPDRMHEEPAVLFADAGYDILIEKPLAPEPESAQRIVEAVERNGVLMTVCHVMRYSSYSRGLKAILDGGRIGQILSIEHLEPIGWWHFAHSYVRGNWAVEADSSSMLMAKSSHDVDWLMHLMGRPVRKVSSFGSLSHFRPENRPAGAAERCTDCPLVESCAYSAPKIYQRFLGDPVGERWPLSVLSPDVSAAGVRAALESGIYGQCVFKGENDVVDHQIVGLEFDNGATASLTVSAFTPPDFRKTRIMGTEGMITGDGKSLVIDDFLTASQEHVDLSGPGSASAADGHGGADTELVGSFLAAVRQQDRGLVQSSAQASFASHQVVWAAECARKEARVVSV
ncbi:Gfo/Idh/MocA family protein [Pseudarthrobacter sp. P1]|uniref:Gfo/Idh/MocA family protein n=1 Tax=Pseudarthrobacter sp. P1 TaxID=3418418 RepID=UPI003CF56F19